MNENVVVVGGGLGGIAAAASLAAEGYNVELLEKNEKLGGKLNVKEIDGFSFDLGPSILTLPKIFNDLFKSIDQDISDYIDLERIDLEWRSFFEDETVIDLYSDLDKMAELNSDLSQKDIKELADYLNYSQDIYQLVEDGYFSEGLDTMWEVFKHYGPIKLIKGFDYFSTMDQGVRRYISNQHLQDVINFFIKYVGSSPYDAPAVLNLLPYVQLEYGLWYVNGGMYNLAEALKDLLEELGVKISCNCEVVELITEDKAVSKARLKDGKIVEGDIFVSNMEVIPAYENLIKEEISFLDKYKQKFEPACSGYVLHLGVDREYEMLAHHNFFFSDNPKEHFNSIFHEYKMPKDPTIYLVATTRTDKTQAPEGCENLKILPHIPHLQDEPFSESDYQELRENILDKLERMGLKNLREHIIVEDVWTPEDIKANYYSNKGSIYGVVSDKDKNKGFKAPKRSKKYDNLFFVGGSVNPGGGMPMVTLSGQQVSDFISSDSVKNV